VQDYDRVEDKLNPVGRAFYAISTMVCTPNALNQEVGAALGAQAGEARIQRSSRAPDSALPARRRDAAEPRLRRPAVMTQVTLDTICGIWSDV
jgi:hypothetical protein